jgi:hypothetical protein
MTGDPEPLSAEAKQAYFARLACAAIIEALPERALSEAVDVLARMVEFHHDRKDGESSE